MQGINLPLIKLPLIMINMENPYIRFEENLHFTFEKPYCFEVLEEDSQTQETFIAKETKSQRSNGQ